MVSIWKDPPAPAIAPFEGMGSGSPFGPPAYPEVILLPPTHRAAADEGAPGSPSSPAQPKKKKAPKRRRANSAPSSILSPEPCTPVEIALHPNHFSEERTWLIDRLKINKAWLCIPSPYLSTTPEMAVGAFLFAQTFLFTFFPFIFYAADVACPHTPFFILSILLSFMSLGATVLSLVTLIKGVAHTKAVKTAADIEQQHHIDLGWPLHRAQERAFHVVEAVHSLTLFFWGLVMALALGVLVSWFRNDVSAWEVGCSARVEADLMTAGAWVGLFTPVVAWGVRTVSALRLGRGEGAQGRN